MIIQSTIYFTGNAKRSIFADNCLGIYVLKRIGESIFRPSRLFGNIVVIAYLLSYKLKRRLACY